MPPSNPTPTPTPNPTPNPTPGPNPSPSPGPNPTLARTLTQVKYLDRDVCVFVFPLSGTRIMAVREGGALDVWRQSK